MDSRNNPSSYKYDSGAASTVAHLSYDALFRFISALESSVNLLGRTQAEISGKLKA